MPEPEDPKEAEKVTNNDLRDSQFGGGFINAEKVNAGRIGGDIWNIGNLFLGRSDSTQSLNPRNRVQQLLLKQVSTEVTSRLEQSLHNRIYIVQDTNQNPEQIELPWASEVKVGSKPKVHLTNTEITTIYDQPEIDGRLLILGEPGVGKTTMLLKLAEELVNRAEDDFAHPIPVLFSLSSWKDDSHSIKNWLVDQLKDKYGVRKDIGKQLVDNQEIIPLLDGLDELAAERQEKCVIKINEFLHPSNWTNPAIVCSRIQAYQQYKALLQLNNSLELQFFTYQQIYQYFQSTNNLQLWNSISQDANLKQLAQTQLFLNIIVLSAQKISIQKWQNFQSDEDRLTYLFEIYIERMLKRPYKEKQPKEEDTKHWLGCLAHQLIEDNSTEFFIERMQPDWLSNKFQKLVYNVIVFGVIYALIFGLINGLRYGLIFELINGLRSGMIFGLIFGLINGLRNGLIFGLINWLRNGVFLGLINWLMNEAIFGLINGLISGEIQPVEKLKFSLNKSFIGLRKWLYNGLLFGLFFWQPFTDLSINRLQNGLYCGLVGGVLGLTNGFYGIELENKTIPNQGIKQSVINTIIISIVTCLSASLLIFLIETNIPKLICLIIHIITKNKCKIESNIPNSNFNEILISCLWRGLSAGLLIGIIKSGTPAIKHFILRVILWSNGYTPWNYAKFLDYCTNRLFLQRVGGGYRFMHDLLRQHFANSYGQTQKRS